jgi:hypothetical protein
MTAIETMPDNCGALIDIVENVKTSLYVMIIPEAFGRQGYASYVRAKSQISGTRCTVAEFMRVRCCSDRPKSLQHCCQAMLRLSRRRPVTRCLRLRWPSMGRIERTRRPDSVHTVLVAALMYGISQRSLSSRPKRLWYRSTCRNYDVVGHGKFM